MDVINNLYNSANFREVYSTLSLVAFSVSAFLVFLIIQRNLKIRTLSISLEKLRKSFSNLDEQAKLIVKTDLELNKAQEELDKRLAGLNALQKMSRLVSTTLDANEMFERLDLSLATDLGFEKILVLILNSNQKLQCRIQSGFSIEFSKEIITQIQQDQDLMNDLKEGHIFSSLTVSKEKKDRVINIFGLNNFILNPIVTQDGFIGLIYVGNQREELLITDGDEELISILSNQIGQSLENTQLFEQVYQSRQQLELKIQERTRQLASALEEVKKTSKLKSEFVSAVSHELRTPLTSVKGYASILMTGKVGDIPQKVKERLEKINKHSDNLVTLINNLLDISRIESGRVEMKFARYDVSSIIENVQDLLTPQMRDKNIEFKTEIGNNLPDIYIDISQVDRVFINIVSNAVKYTPEQGTITIKADLKGDFVHFQVVDTGIGIKEDDISRLFDEFYRVDNEFNQNVKGTGLGLSLVKNIVEAHKGKIWITSTVNVGTTFHFTLPIFKENTFEQQS